MDRTPVPLVGLVAVVLPATAEEAEVAEATAVAAEEAGVAVVTTMVPEAAEEVRIILEAIKTTKVVQILVMGTSPLRSCKKHSVDKNFIA